MKYTEDILVQQASVDYLEQQLGWRSTLAWNNEDFGPDSLLGRESDREVVLTRILREKLVALNPELPEAAYDAALRHITSTIGSQTLVAANREKYDLLRDGVQVTFRNAEGERVRQRLRIVDFDNLGNNDFLAVRELWVRGDLYRRRADIVGFVNGLPLLFIECKNIHKNLRAAFERNFSDYLDTIPHLFHHNAIVMFGNGEQARIGSITSRWEHFNEWKRLGEDSPGTVDMEILLMGVCDRQNFLDIIENFILFDDSMGETRKIIARNHQFLGLNRAVAALRKRKERQGRLGVFWHTQGSGKSYSMVMFTRKVHRKLGGNFTFLILTDREDLDTQIAFYWDERIRELEKALTNITDEQEVIFFYRQIAWMRETRMAVVVVSEEQGEVAKFRAWDLDITPHRRLMKEGIDPPDSMRSRPEYRNMQTVALDDAFKADEHLFRIAIVCAMWLTGFDVPSLSTLYLDKPLKAHTLMQAIARANRVAEGKNNGLIVDYCGILKHLRKALATFAGTGQEGQGDKSEPAKPEEELLEELAEAIGLVRAFLNDRDASLDEILNNTGFKRNAAIAACKEAANENDESRKRFELMCRAVFKKFKACINVSAVNRHRADRDAINIVYKSLQQDREQADISGIIRQLHEVVDAAIAIEPNQREERASYDISKIDFGRLRQEFERSAQKNTTVQSLRQAVERQLQKLLEQNPLRTDFQQHYEQIIAEYNREKDRVTIEKTFEALLMLARELDEEERRAVREGLDEESLAIFDLLKKPNLEAGEIKRIKAVAVELLEMLKAEKLRIDHWRDKEAARDAVRGTIRDYFWDDKMGLPVSAFGDDDVNACTEEVFRHIFRVYPTLPSPYFAAPAMA